MNADESNAPRDVQWRAMGVGLQPRRLCDGCLRPKSQTGSKTRQVGPLRLWYCAVCVARKEAAA